MGKKKQETDRKRCKTTESEIIIGKKNHRMPEEHLNTLTETP